MSIDCFLCYDQNGTDIGTCNMKSIHHPFGVCIMKNISTFGGAGILVGLLQHLVFGWVLLRMAYKYRIFPLL
jgi:hypothetical protein